MKKEIKIFTREELLGMLHRGELDAHWMVIIVRAIAIRNKSRPADLKEKLKKIKDSLQEPSVGSSLEEDK